MMIYAYLVMRGKLSKHERGIKIMALDGLNGFGFVYENAGYTSPYASTGFTAPEGYKTPVDELQTELTGKKKKAGKPKKAVKPKKASVPRPKVNYNGTVTYGSLTFKNVEEFKRAFPEIKVPKAIASRVKTPPVVTPAPQTYYEYLMEKINGGKQQKPFTPPFEQPTGQPTEKPAQPVPPAQPEEPEKSEENQAQQPQFEEISVVKGSSEWKYAELELISEHLGQAGYRPTNQEITDRMMQIIEREKKALEEAKANDPEGKNRHSVPTLKVGDDLKVSPELKKLIDEATKELKEAHKDNPNYKVTWTELRAKVQEKIAA